MTGLRKWSLSILALIFSFVLGWRGSWEPNGWAWVLMACLGTHAAGSVGAAYMSRGKVTKGKT